MDHLTKLEEIAQELTGALDGILKNEERLNKLNRFDNPQEQLGFPKPGYSYWKEAGLKV